MALEAPAILVALEQSALGMAIRQSVWIYPAANTAHILGLTVLAASVASWICGCSVRSERPFRLQ